MLWQRDELQAAYREMHMRTVSILSSVAIAVAFAGTCLFAQDATTRPVSPAETSDAPINVGFLTLDGVYNSELMAPWDIFHHTVFHTTPGMRVFTVGREKGVVTTFEGLRLDVEYALEDAPRIDVLVVPSARHNMGTDLQDDRLIAWVKPLSFGSSQEIRTSDPCGVAVK